ncbi:BolA family transcriptional regulator [Anaplasma capra]|nr:BolA family protein [Anaplasma capra]MCU7611349.1 BolA family transcriptional regulator [Anaplasma capra]
MEPTGSLDDGLGAQRVPPGGEHLGIAQSIREKILTHIGEAQVEVTDESGLHAGHSGSLGYRVSHLRVSVVSDSFAGMSRLHRWRLLHEVLADEVKMVHSISFLLTTSNEQLDG